MNQNEANGPLAKEIRNCSSSRSCSGMPTMASTALFTRMSTVPVASTTEATQALTSSEFSTLQIRCSALPPASAMRAIVSAAVSLLRSTTTMTAPSRAIANAMPRPTPCPAPVTIATLPSRMPALLVEVICLDTLSRQCADDQRVVGPHTAVVAPFHEQWQQHPVERPQRKAEGLAVGGIELQPVGLHAEHRSPAPPRCPILA